MCLLAGLSLQYKSSIPGPWLINSNSNNKNERTINNRWLEGRKNVQQMIIRLLYCEMMMTDGHWQFNQRVAAVIDKPVQERAGNRDLVWSGRDGKSILCATVIDSSIQWSNQEIYSANARSTTKTVDWMCPSRRFGSIGIKSWKVFHHEMRYLPVQFICGLSLTDFDRIRESFSTQRSFKCASQRELTSYCSVAIEIPFPGSVFFVCHWEKVKNNR